MVGVAGSIMAGPVLGRPVWPKVPAVRDDGLWAAGAFGRDAGGMTEIVVGVDESVGAAHALRWAIREAELRGGDVVATMAWGLLDQHPRVVDSVPFDPHYGQASADAALAEYVRAVAGAEPSVPIERRTVCGLAADVLLEAADGADLLVLGARGLGGFQGLLLGSVSQRCLHQARTPIAVVHQADALESGGDRRERVVVGIDGSANGERALAWALDEARARHATLDVVHAWHHPVTLAWSYAEVVWDPAPLEAAAREVLDDVLDRADLDGLVAPPRRLVVCAAAARALIDAATGADLVVLGARGLGAVRGALLGSVSQQVAVHAPCPVVVIPTPR